MSMLPPEFRALAVASIRQSGARYCSVVAKWWPRDGSLLLGQRTVALEVSASTVCRSVLTPPGPGGHPSLGGSWRHPGGRASGASPSRLSGGGRMSATKLLVLGVVHLSGSAHGYQVRSELQSWGVESWAK